MRVQDLVPGVGFPLVLLSLVHSAWLAVGTSTLLEKPSILVSLPHHCPYLIVVKGPRWKLGLNLMLCSLLVSG